MNPKTELAANVLSSVIVVGGTLFALHGYFFSKGPIVPDWRSRPEQIVIANFDALAEKRDDPIRLRFDDRLVELSKFLTRDEHTPSEQTLRSLLASERQIGKLYTEADSPIVVGDIIVQIIDNGPQKAPHLLREPDWASARVGLFSVAFGVLVFFLGQIVRVQ